MSSVVELEVTRHLGRAEISATGSFSAGLELAKQFQVALLRHRCCNWGSYLRIVVAADPPEQWRNPWMNLNEQAPSFTLRSTAGDLVSLGDAAGANGTLVMFICNHCPYVIGAIDRINDVAKRLNPLGVGVIAISSNDVDSHPADSFENMKLKATEWGLVFPYLWDETQEVARFYNAACTPDFFGLNGEGILKYRGRLDEGGRKVVPGARPELLEAMTMIAQTGEGPVEQWPSIGCSIKWKAGR